LAMETTIVRGTRHVITTTLTTIAGFVPLLLDRSGFWPPLAIAIAGGLGGATLLALFFVPSLYLILVRRGWLKVEASSAPVASPTLAREFAAASSAAPLPPASE
ncbi:MAG: efflux RND transporter permease subunit, partial [Cyanobacteria bacterium J06648_11]